MISILVSKDKIINRVIGMFTLVLALRLVFNLHMMVVDLSADSQILGAVNSDTAYTIKVSDRSRLFENNGFYHYGALYFKLVKLMSSVSPAFPIYGTSHRDNERSISYNAFLLNLASAFIFLFFLSHIAFKDFLYSFLSAGGLLSLLFDSSYTFSHFIFRVHPEILFASLIGITHIFALENFLCRDKINSVLSFVLVGFLIGLSLSVKLSTLLFLPGLLIITLRQFFTSKYTLKSFIRVYLVLFVLIVMTYLLVGYPQHFEIEHTLNAIKKFSRYSSDFKIETLHFWLRTYKVYWPMLLLCIAPFLLNKELDRKKLIFAFCAVFLHVPILLSRSYVSGVDHYVFSSIFTLLAFISVVKKKLQMNVAFSLILFGIYAKFAFSTENLNSLYVKYTNCRNEYEVFLDQMRDYSSNGLVLVDPYSPIIESEGVEESWRHKLSDITDDVSAIMISERYAARFLLPDVPSYVKVDNPDWSKTVDYYSVFVNNDTPVLSYQGQVFRRKFNKCRLKVWVKE